MKIQEINTFQDKELKEKLENAQAMLVNLKLTHAVSPLENSSQIRATRRDIARMKTILHQRECSK